MEKTIPDNNDASDSEVINDLVQAAEPMDGEIHGTEAFINGVIHLN